MNAAERSLYEAVARRFGNCRIPLSAQTYFAADFGGGDRFNFGT